mmetsp:Transcript_118149/g.176563  ORF Transcript_118149/g.176563 Transcript_118149/m.176563 type:complete len:128 (-) Transcript_118149:31-414(-)
MSESCPNGGFGEIQTGRHDDAIRRGGLQSVECYEYYVGAGEDAIWISFDLHSGSENVEKMVLVYGNKEREKDVLVSGRMMRRKRIRRKVNVCVGMDWKNVWFCGGFVCGCGWLLVSVQQYSPTLSLF